MLLSMISYVYKNILPAGFYQQDFTLKKITYFNTVNLNQLIIYKK